MMGLQWGGVLVPGLLGAMGGRCPDRNHTKKNKGRGVEGTNGPYVPRTNEVTGDRRRTRRRFVARGARCKSLFPRYGGGWVKSLREI